MKLPVAVIAVLLAVLLAPMLGACSDLQSERQLVDAQATYNTQDDNQCRSYGATTGTDPYFQCRRELAKEHVEAESARQAQQRAVDQPPQSSADQSH